MTKNYNTEATPITPPPSLTVTAAECIEMFNVIVQLVLFLLIPIRFCCTFKKNQCFITVE